MDPKRTCAVARPEKRSSFIAESALNPRPRARGSYRRPRADVLAELGARLLAQSFPEYRPVSASAPESEQGDALIGATLAGRYRVERLLGSGGMGAVYQAEHVHMRKAVAVKVLHREMMMVPEVVARFEREAVAAGRIQHPHVAAATDFGRLDDG